MIIVAEHQIVAGFECLVANGIQNDDCAEVALVGFGVLVDVIIRPTIENQCFSLVICVVLQFGESYLPLCPRESGIHVVMFGGNFVADAEFGGVEVF